MTSTLGIIYAMQVSSFGIANLEAKYGVRLLYRIVIKFKVRSIIKQVNLNDFR